MLGGIEVRTPPGIRAAVLDIKPGSGMYLVVELPEEKMVQMEGEFGSIALATILAPMVIRSATTALTQKGRAAAAPGAPAIQPDPLAELLQLGVSSGTKAVQKWFRQ